MAAHFAYMQFRCHATELATARVDPRQREAPRVVQKHRSTSRCRTVQASLAGVQRRKKMTVLPLRKACAMLVLAGMCLWAHAAMAQTTTSRMVSAANAFLATLDQKQRQSVLFTFTDEKQRTRCRTCRCPWCRVRASA
jgi:hypothetical protein